VVAEFRTRQPGGSPVFVLQGLSDQQSSLGTESAGVDSCFLGGWVCGSSRFERWRQALAKCGFEAVRAEASRRTYRFGKGVAEAVATWVVPVQVGEMLGDVEVDVVRGSLPALIGQAAQERFSLIVDGGRRQIVQRVGATVRVLDSYDRGQLPNVSVLPGQGDCWGQECATWVAKASEASVSAEAETRRVSVAAQLFAETQALGRRELLPWRRTEEVPGQKGDKGSDEQEPEEAVLAGRKG